jgi:hypothetical protein
MLVQLHTLFHWKGFGLVRVLFCTSVVQVGEDSSGVVNSKLSVDNSQSHQVSEDSEKEEDTHFS